MININCRIKNRLIFLILKNYDVTCAKFSNFPVRDNQSDVLFPLILEIPCVQTFKKKKGGN